MKRLREEEAPREDAPLLPLPAEIWCHLTTFFEDEKDYKALVLAVPELGRYVLHHSAWLVPLIKEGFGHVLVFREPKSARRLLFCGPFEFEDMDQLWQRRGLLHRLDGPALLVTRPLHSYYYEDGLLHCGNGDPALRSKYFCAWYNKGQLTKVMVRGCDDEFVPDKSYSGHPVIRNIKLVLDTQGLRFENTSRDRFGPLFQSRNTGARGTLERIRIPLPGGLHGFWFSRHLRFCPLTESD
jgi:hypothetical protein